MTGILPSRKSGREKTIGEIGFTSGSTDAEEDEILLTVPLDRGSLPVSSVEVPR